ncbi:MAG: DUF3035 domain-containing protein [Hyphomonadaceae bacterium]|nr:DUF3035 domain-containing protein [Hyphomonadaceae bacterium]
MKRIVLLGFAAIAATGATACSSMNTPDEFRVVRKAPLTVPPEYNLRPPAPGSSRPQELSSESQARVAVFGVDFGQQASEGEKAFVKAAGGDAVDRSVRSAVDYDNAQILRKNRSFADAILNFGQASPNDPVLDAAAEAERLRAQEEALKDITGGGKVIIQPKQTSKLPGL